MFTWAMSVLEVVRLGELLLSVIETSASSALQIKLFVIVLGFGVDVQLLTDESDSGTINFYNFIYLENCIMKSDGIMLIIGIS